MINPVRAYLTQYYTVYLQDDIMWVYWGSTHTLSTVMQDWPGVGFRPVSAFLYVVGYDLFGANIEWYYLLNGVFFSVGMVFLYLLTKELSNHTAGIIAVIFYLLLDHSFMLVWKAFYITSISEICFMLMALYFFTMYFKYNKHLCFALLTSVLAFLSKEPAFIIIPVYNIFYLLYNGFNRKYNSLEIGLNLIPMVLLMFIQVGNTAPGLSMSLITDRVKDYLFYEIYQFKTITTFILIPLGLIYGKFVHRAGIILFCAGIAPLLISSYTAHPPYLAEANIGMAILFGSSITLVLHNSRTEIITFKKIAIICLVSLVILFQIFTIPFTIQSTNAFHNTIVERQDCFESAINDIVNTVPHNDTVYYHTDKKVNEQVNTTSIYKLLCLYGRGDINVLQGYNQTGYNIVTTF